jgi:predicted glutamine amidotransferase
MCRFVLYHGTPLTIASLVTEPVHSIINQSVAALESEEPLNGDGFGVAWFVPELSENPAAFRSVSPAWSNQNLLQLARVTRSGHILAHVRAATRGLPVEEANCHPFTHGTYAFMHNGDVGRFRQIRRKLLMSLTDPGFDAIHGSTDSEHLFGVFLDEVSRSNTGDGAESMAAALERAIGRVTKLATDSRGSSPLVDGDDSYLNIAISNGHCSVACRYTTSEGEPSSLYVHTGRRYVCEDGVCRMIAPERGHGAVIVASERLSEDPGWQKIPRNHLVTISREGTANIRAMNIPV